MTNTVCLLMLLLLESTMGYLHEVSIGVFMEVADKELFAAINRTMKEVSTMKDGYNVIKNDSLTTVGISLLAVPIQLDSIDPFPLRIEANKANLDEMTALISLVSCRTTKMLHTFPLIYQIPMMHIKKCEDTQDNSMTSPMVLPMDYGYKDILHVLVEIMKYASWREVVICHDGTIDNQRLSRLSGRLSAELISFMFIDFLQFNDDYIAKNRHQLLHSPHFVTLCSETNSVSLLRKVRISSLDLLGPNYMWLVVLEEGIMDIQSLESVFLDGDNTALLLSPKPLENEQKRFKHAVINMKRALEDYISNHSNIPTSAQRNLTYPFNRSDGNSFTHLLQEHLKTCEICTDYDILSLTHGKTNGEPHFIRTGHWHRQLGLNMFYHLYPFSHLGYNNRKFIVGTLHDPPLTKKYDNGTWGGVLVELLDELAESLNFSYEIREPNDQQWGAADKYGKYNGMIGMLQQNEIDFALGLFTITQGRKNVVDFSSALLIDHLIIAMKRPNLSDSKMFLCLGPFSLEVWVAVLCSVIVTGVLIWIVTRCHPLRDKMDSESKEVYQLPVNLWQAMGAILQQGMVYVPSYHSSRVVIALWWLFILVVIGTYNGNLIAFLTAPKVNVPISSLEELVKSGMSIGLSANTASQDIFEYSTSGIYKEVWNIVKSDRQHNLVSGNKDGFRKMQENPKFAYIVDMFYYEIVSQEAIASSVATTCSFIRSKHGFYQSIYALPFQKHSPYVRNFSHRILQILESGLLKHWKDLYRIHRSACSGLERTTDQTTISLAEAQGAFYILGIGLVIGMVSLLSEWLYSRRQTRQRAQAKAQQRENAEKRVYYVGMPPSVECSDTMKLEALRVETEPGELNVRNGIRDTEMDSIVHDADDIIEIIDASPKKGPRSCQQTNNHGRRRWRPASLGSFNGDCSWETHRRMSEQLRPCSIPSLSMDSTIASVLCESDQSDMPVFEEAIEPDAETGEHPVNETVELSKSELAY